MAACQKRRIKSYWTEIRGEGNLEMETVVSQVPLIDVRQGEERKGKRSRVERREKSNTNTDQSDHRNNPIRSRQEKAHTSVAMKRES
jgi:hypothetical protein